MQSELNSQFVSNTYIFTCLSFYTSLEVQQELVFSSKRFDHTAMIFFSGNTIQHINRHSYRNTNLMTKLTKIGKTRDLQM